MESALAPPEKKKAKKTAGNTLPDDLIFNILSRLTIIQHARFKSVSKEWQSLLTDPSFVKLLKNYPRVLISMTRSEGTKFSSMNLLGSPSDKANRTFDSPYKFTSIKSCNGLMFMSCKDHKQKFVCNPTTGQIVRLPSPPNENSVASWYAFGYLPSMKEYKLVHMFVRERCECEVLAIRDGESVGLGSWKVIPNCPWYFVATDTYVCANGVIYWIYSGRVAWLDLEAEEFGYFTSVPREEDHYKKIYKVKFVELDGSLCVEYNVGCVLDIWMKIDRKKGMWRKVFRITIPGGNIWRIGFVVEGVLLVFYNDEEGIIVYNMLKHSYKKVAGSTRSLRPFGGHLTLYIDTAFSVIQ